jgi:septal ring factor EnvC (AmiA/AmiB activator)
MQLNIFKASQQLKEVEAEKAQLVSDLAKLEKDLAEAHDVIGNFMVKQKEFDATIEATRKEYQTKLDALEIQLTEVKTSVNQEAAQVLASIGVEPEVIPASKMDTKGSVLEQFNKLTGKEKSAFYQANREEILKSLSLI